MGFLVRPAGIALVSLGIIVAGLWIRASIESRRNIDSLWKNGSRALGMATVSTREVTVRRGRFFSTTKTEKEYGVWFRDGGWRPVFAHVSVASRVLREGQKLSIVYDPKTYRDHEIGFVYELGSLAEAAGEFASEALKAPLLDDLEQPTGRQLQTMLQIPVVSDRVASLFRAPILGGRAGCAPGTRLTELSTGEEEQLTHVLSELLVAPAKQPVPERASLGLCALDIQSARSSADPRVVARLLQMLIDLPRDFQDQTERAILRIPVLPAKAIVDFVPQAVQKPDAAATLERILVKLSVDDYRALNTAVISSTDPVARIIFLRALERSPERDPRVAALIKEILAGRSGGDNDRLRRAAAVVAPRYLEKEDAAAAISSLLGEQSNGVGLAQRALAHTGGLVDAGPVFEEALRHWDKCDRAGAEQRFQLLLKFPDKLAQQLPGALQTIFADPPGGCISLEPEFSNPCQGPTAANGARMAKLAELMAARVPSLQRQLTEATQSSAPVVRYFVAILLTKGGSKAQWESSLLTKLAKEDFYFIKGRALMALSSRGPFGPLEREVLISKQKGITCYNYSLSNRKEFKEISTAIGAAADQIIASSRR